MKTVKLKTEPYCYAYHVWPIMKISWKSIQSFFVKLLINHEQHPYPRHTFIPTNTHTSIHPQQIYKKNRPNVPIVPCVIF